MRIAVIGTGYVGLVSGTCFAETGNYVICVDNNAEKVNQLLAGKLPIYEPGLEVLFQRNTRLGRLHFTTDLEKAVKESQIIFLALPTPAGQDGSADLSYVLTVAHQLGPMIDEYKIIVDKSTVPVGTAEKVRQIIAAHAQAEFDVVSNPEFLREGVAVEDFLKPDRVVIGTSSPKAKEIMQRLYEPYVRQGNPIIFMDERSAEMTKYAANAYLATRISFMNEIANLCELLGADVDQVRRGIGSDKRIGPRFLFPGVGYGGSCFPKDVQALSLMAKQHHYHFRILEAVMAVNQRQRHVLTSKIKDFYGNELAGKKIAVWGLAFKPNTDDIREAPALYIIEDLLNEGAFITAFDPEAIENTRKVLGNRISYASDPYQALEGADALAIITEWGEFRTPDFDRMASLMKAKVIFDGRNLYHLETMQERDWYYASIGRKTILPHRQGEPS
ncbi:MAG: UDP-glucose/GDP-mannose dehydrogenase family protein [Cytophagales bacterium]|nr:UDP-glucose/GDP-mannose dehydrogenase family protein [Bernardetiaceae bacterium]MDW8210606.1 UDP-glucose/GDP-mannose dehydrogenase family protein [Cytophagales bacterium]